MPEAVTDFHQQVDSFLSHLLIERGLAAQTIASYSSDLNFFTQFLSAQNISDIKEVDTAIILKYLIDLRQTGRQARTRARHLVALRGFFDYLHQKKEIDHNIAKQIDLPKAGLKLPDVLDTFDIEKIIAAPDRTTHKGMRNAAMLEVIYAAGLRVSELVQLMLANINLEVGFVRVLGKGNKERIVPIGRRAVDCLRSYLENRQTGSTRQENQSIPVCRLGWQSDDTSGILENLTQLCFYRRIDEKDNPTQHAPLVCKPLVGKWS